MKRPSESRFNRPFEWLLDDVGRVSREDSDRLRSLRDSWLEAVDEYRDGAMNTSEAVDLLRIHGRAATTEMRFIAATEAVFHRYRKDLNALDWDYQEKTHEQDWDFR